MILYIYVFKVIFIQNVGHEDGSHFGNEKQFHRQTTGWLSAAEIRPRLFSHLKARQSPSVRTYAHWLPLIECLASWAAHPQLVRHYVVWILHWWFKAYVSSDMDLKGNEGFQSFQVPEIILDYFSNRSDRNKSSDMTFKSNFWSLLLWQQSFRESRSHFFLHDWCLTLQRNPSNGYDDAAFWTSALSWYLFFKILFVLSKARHASLASVVLCIKPYGAFC